jgi:hypothetical protein
MHDPRADTSTLQATRGVRQPVSQAAIAAWQQAKEQRMPPQLSGSSSAAGSGSASSVHSKAKALAMSRAGVAERSVPPPPPPPPPAAASTTALTGLQFLGVYPLDDDPSPENRGGSSGDTKLIQSCSGTVAKWQ